MPSKNKKTNKKQTDSSILSLEKQLAKLQEKLARTRSSEFLRATKAVKTATSQVSKEKKQLLAAKKKLTNRSHQQLINNDRALPKNYWPVARKVSIAHRPD